MKESVEGTLLINVVLIFISLFIALLAIGVSYSRAFIVKNEIINIIEKYQGYPGIAGRAETNVREELGSRGYPLDRYKVIPCPTSRGTYYRVETYIAFEFPVVGGYMKFPITGETRVMVNK
jgi:hypothetical protein